MGGPLRRLRAVLVRQHLPVQLGVRGRLLRLVRVRLVHTVRLVETGELRADDGQPHHPALHGYAATLLLELLDLFLVVRVDCAFSEGIERPQQRAQLVELYLQLLLPVLVILVGRGAAAGLKAQPTPPCTRLALPMGLPLISQSWGRREDRWRARRGQRKCVRDQ
jgi:hypothetical protein